MGGYAEPIKSKLKRKKAIYGNFLHNILVNYALNNKNLMNKLYCNQTGSHNLLATVSSLPNNIPGMKEIKGLIKVDIINLNLKIKYENSKKLSW